MQQRPGVGAFFITRSFQYLLTERPRKGDDFASSIKRNDEPESVYESCCAIFNINARAVAGEAYRMRFHRGWHSDCAPSFDSCLRALIREMKVLASRELSSLHASLCDYEQILAEHKSHCAIRTAATSSKAIRKRILLSF